jgi:hypothetical protein
LYFFIFFGFKNRKVGPGKKICRGETWPSQKSYIQKLEKINALVNLSDYYYRTRNSAKAYEFLQSAANLKDSMLSETNIKQMNTLAAIYESDKKAKRNPTAPK